MRGGRAAHSASPSVSRRACTHSRLALEALAVLDFPRRELRAETDLLGDGGRGRESRARRRGDGACGCGAEDVAQWAEAGEEHGVPDDGGVRGVCCGYMHRASGSGGRLGPTFHRAEAASKEGERECASLGDCRRNGPPSCLRAGAGWLAGARWLARTVYAGWAARALSGGCALCVYSWDDGH